MIDDPFETLFLSCVDRTGEPYTAAREELRRRGGEIAGPLEERAAATDWATHTTARILLGWIRDRSLFEQVTSILRDRDSAPRRVGLAPAPTASAAAVAALGSKVVPRLIEILTKTHEHRDGISGQVVLLALDYLRDPLAVMPLRRLALDTADEQERTLAVAALGGIGDDRAFDLARDVFNDAGRGEVLRGTAALCLGRLGLPEAGEVLLAAARRAGEGSTVRASAVRAIGYLGDPAHVAGLRQVLEGETADGALALEAVGALARLGDAPALRQAARSHPLSAVRSAAQEAAAGLDPG
ncbi:HEAT repeat domain-containing protein [Nonomuraea antri]|uniref:HEAT repeat domain-containing protein n=1 Tax=Nonomuraea antri TaxID=2730852 RepID=UPI001F22A426|nr:HEAT repeat domain-containing protein [Nonomuraea antri]